MATLERIILQTVDGRNWEYQQTATLTDKYAFIRKWRAMLSDELILVEPLNAKGVSIGDIYIQKGNILKVEFEETADD